MVASTTNGSVKCTSFQVSRVRYLTMPDVQANQMVITGSWMEEVNRLCLWQYDCGHLIDSGQIVPESEQEDDCAPGVLGDSLDDPRLLSSIVHAGWVQELKIHQSSQHIFVVSSLGCLQIFRMDPSSSPRLVRLSPRWIPFPSTTCLPGNQPIALSSLTLSADARHAFVGDDLGRLALVDIGRMPLLQPGDDQDMLKSSTDTSPCLQTGNDITSVNALERIDASLLAGVNQLGQLKVWDIRCGLDKPQQRLLRPSDAQPLYCLAHHPGQPHLLSVGGVACSGAGAYIWDLRAEQYPLTEVACGGRAVLELQFHPCQPKHLFVATETAGLLQISCRDDAGCWTGFKGSRKKLTVSSALPPDTIARDVISFDLSNTRLVCGHSDGILQTVDCNVSVY